MHKLAWSQGFKRSFKKASRKNTALQEKIFTVLDVLCQNPFDSQLKTHKLHGKLAGLWACVVEHDCRIVFIFENSEDANEVLIVLADIGKHDEVY